MRPLAARLARGAAALALSFATTALAEGPPDVVLRNDGGMLRGSIVELVPGDFVVLQLADGTTRRVPMSEVKYAGPASGAPGAAAASAEPPAAASSSASAPSGQGGTETHRPMVTVRTTEAKLSLRSEPQGLTFHRHVATGQVEAFEVMCTAPCEITMGAGTHKLALSTKDGQPVEADPVAVGGDGELQGAYTDKSGTRTVGWVVFGVGQVAGYGMALAGLLAFEEPNVLVASAGGAVLIGGIVAGIVMGSTTDEATITFVPAVAAPPPSRTPAVGDARADAASAPAFLGAAAWGGTLVARF